jgi:hypothetical protein
MNRRRFLTVSVAALATGNVLAKEDLTGVKLPALKSNFTFKLERYNIQSWLKDSIFQNCYYRTNQDENSSFALVNGEEIIRMGNTRGYASQLYQDEPIESLISRSINDLTENIYNIEGHGLISYDVKRIDTDRLKGDIDISEADTLKGLVDGEMTDAYISKRLFDRFFGHDYDKVQRVACGKITVHKSPWMDNCFGIHCPQGLETYYSQSNIVLLNRNIGEYIRYVPYSERFVQVSYEQYEHNKRWGVTTHFLHAVKKFNTEVYTGFLNVKDA